MRKLCSSRPPYSARRARYRAGGAPAGEEHIRGDDEPPRVGRRCDKAFVIARNDVGLRPLSSTPTIPSATSVPGSAASRARRLPDRPKDRRRERRLCRQTLLAPLVPPGAGSDDRHGRRRLLRRPSHPSLYAAAQLPGGSSMASLIAATHEVEQRHAGPGGSRGSILQQQQSASEGPLVAPKPLSFSSARSCLSSTRPLRLSADCGRPGNGLGRRSLGGRSRTFIPMRA